ncbi:zinc/iron regulated transporter-related protein 88E [Colletes latitarsis]|uniref:zinc/iron regulated transporter-related protein 88E n=1 Tax=Colletes latitarsis TaxID=2605962 RepID=UPI004036D2A1
MTITVIQAKFASMIAIGVGSFVVGVAPACFVSRVRDLQQRLLLSCTLCFGGGVLLATAILHMLPETRESMPKHAELVFACGFLLLYLIDEIVHYFWGNDIEHTVESQRYDVRNGVTPSQVYSGSTRTVGGVYAPEVNPKGFYQSSVSGFVPSNLKNSTYGAVQYAPNAPSFSEEATFLCHGNHSEPCSDAKTGLVGLLLALTMHSILEGLAIGLQKAMSEVLLLVGAVASHKFVVGFCLGLELAGANSSLLRLVSAIFFFSAGSAVGIGIGMLTLRMDKKWTHIVLPVLQGLAGGTLLYVTVSEIFPRERARWHRSERRASGIFQFFSAAVGFLIIFLLNNYVGS